jgi:hypothetical protein
VERMLASVSDPGPFLTENFERLLESIDTI